MILSGHISAQSSFYKQFSGNGYDFGQGIVGLPDSSYVITGASSSFSEGSSDMFLLKIDSLGNYIWSHHYGGEETDWGKRVAYLENSGFFVGGYTNSSGNGAYDFALWKIDEAGNQEWFKTYGTSGWERVNGMAVTEDNGVILVGETNSTSDGFTDIYIVKTDSNGNLIWENQIENPGMDNALTIQQYDDSTFIIGGYLTNSTTLLQQSWVTRIKDDGTELWTQIWGDDFNFDVTDIEIQNQDIYSVGAQYSTTNNDQYLSTSKINGTDGSILAINVTQNTPEVGVGITTFNTPTQLAVCTSIKGAYSYGEEDLFFFWFNDLIYINAIGTIQYQTSQIFGEIITTYNHGAIAVGYNENIGPGGSSIFIFRMGAGETSLGANDDQTTNPLVSVEKLESIEHDINIYPNPATGKLFIKAEKLSDDLNFSISFSDLLGRENLNVSLNKLHNSSIDISSLSSGIYTISIESESGYSIMKGKIEVRN